MASPRACLLLIAITLPLAHCAVAADHLPPLPQGGRRVDLRLSMTTTDRKFTFFTVTPKGELGFGGGKLARQHIAKPILTLSPNQMQELWNLIERFSLTKPHPKPRGKQAYHVRYDLTLQPRGMPRRHLIAYDNQVPGLRKLHDALFKIQANKRYHLPAWLDKKNTSPPTSSSH